MDIFQEIKTKLSMKEIYSFYTNANKINKNYALCPFHSDKSPSLYVYDKKFKCFSCDASGDMFDFVGLICNIQKPIDIARRISTDFCLEIKEFDVSKKEKCDYLKNKEQYLEFIEWRIDFSKEVFKEYHYVEDELKKNVILDDDAFWNYVKKKEELEFLVDCFICEEKPTIASFKKSRLYPVFLDGGTYYEG